MRNLGPTPEKSPPTRVIPNCSRCDAPRDTASARRRTLREGRVVFVTYYSALCADCRREASSKRSARKYYRATEALPRRSNPNQPLINALRASLANYARLWKTCPRYFGLLIDHTERLIARYLADPDLPPDPIMAHAAQVRAVASDTGARSYPRVIPAHLYLPDHLREGLYALALDNGLHQQAHFLQPTRAEAIELYLSERAATGVNVSRKRRHTNKGASPSDPNHEHDPGYVIESTPPPAQHTQQAQPMYGEDDDEWSWEELEAQALALHASERGPQEPSQPAGKGEVAPTPDEAILRLFDES